MLSDCKDSSYDSRGKGWGTATGNQEPVGLSGQAWSSWFDPAQGAGLRGVLLERGQQAEKKAARAS